MPKAFHPDGVTELRTLFNTYLEKSDHPEIYYGLDECAVSVLSSIQSLLHVLADYANFTHEHSTDRLFADDYDLACSLAVVSDLCSIARDAVSVELNCVDRSNTGE